MREEFGMAIQVTHWQRRDAADRNALGQAAFGLCRALRAEDGVDDSRFYWLDPDTVVIQTAAKSAEVFGRDPGREAATAFFALADLARQTGTEQWIDPRTGQANYEQAGRAG